MVPLALNLSRRSISIGLGLALVEQPYHNNLVRTQSKNAESTNCQDSEFVSSSSLKFLLVTMGSST